MNIFSAAAGSGKTTQSLYLAKELILRGLNVVYTSITNVSVEDATKRFEEFFSEILTKEQFEMFKISTVHSYCLELLRNHPEFNGIELIPTTEFVALDIESDPFILSETEEDNELKIEKFKDIIRSRTETHDGRRRNIIPLDWVIRAAKAFNLKSPQSDAIIIDEYQDMEQQELQILGDIFEDNAYLWGDINQSVYLFRSKSNQSWRLMKAPAGGKVETYRFNQYSADILNRYLKVKAAILPTGTSALVEMFSKKEDNTKSIVPFHFRETIDATRYVKPISWEGYTYNKQIYEPMKEIIAEGKDSFQIISMSNSIASVYSTLVTKTFGRILSSWYIPVHSHPAYRIIRDTLRSNSFSSMAVSRLPTALYEMFSKLGYRTNRSKIYNSLLRISQGRSTARNTRIDYSKHPSDIIDAIRALSERKVHNLFRASHSASSKSNVQSAINTLNYMCERGLGAALQGVQLQSETGTERGRVTTIHTSKGTESDYVLLDIQGQIRNPRTVQDLIQNMNMIYVAMSRQKKLLWVAMRQEDINFIEDSDEYYQSHALRCINYFTNTAGISFEDVSLQEDVMTGAQQRMFNEFIPITMALAMNPNYDINKLVEAIKGDEFLFD